MRGKKYECKWQQKGEKKWKGKLKEVVEKKQYNKEQGTRGGEAG